MFCSKIELGGTNFAYWRKRKYTRSRERINFGCRKEIKIPIFFINSPRRGKSIIKLKKKSKMHGECKETDGEIQGVITNYFMKLFEAGVAGDGFLEREKVCSVFK